MSGHSANRPGWVSPPVRRVSGVVREPLTAWGERVWVAPVCADDLEPYGRALALSADRIRVWNPVDPRDLETHLRFQTSAHRTFVIHAVEPIADAGHDIVGVVNVTGVVRGRAMSAAVGYNAYDPYQGRGLFAEGFRLVVDVAFEAEPLGMGLHRVEASVQPGNVRSAGLLRSVGFRRRGFWPAYLWLGDERGVHAWRDHETYGMTVEEWPAVPFSVGSVPSPVVVVGPQWGDAGVELAVQLEVPFIAAGVVEALGDEGLGALLRGVRGAVIELPRPTDEGQVRRVEVAMRLAGADVGAELTVAGDVAPVGRHRVVALALRARSEAHAAVRGVRPV
ncbi:GNAT family N-acetyltransferase [Dermatophilus congolensis]|uniref:GNAT family N-acetyltransferase n=1 Tax=Dermatophilus congolensis TaxID=1863 RepID=UPI001AAF1823|nr:GNAT family protein [Dermatophilus congolensis]MBO3128831.1 GNAT family N-acetyltransferase [Dermatophilus congolensis]MBO3132531.1 GNAT family N-acetyltransferase [Dermatophilus congolensis]MBO3133308.1 GNAT family N-acetyltransferase [Dermatophilus congolensis]MBO3135543.1 GNAT family N-acetyltransferase [Dermatophilus congolensis]MBO3137782.1 GNAT family N-acetyltransferase [Dermatophilus congolensis]